MTYRLATGMWCFQLIKIWRYKFVKGFTLIEVLVALLIVAMVLIAAQSFYVGARTFKSSVEKKLQGPVAIEESLLALQIDVASAYLQAPIKWKKTPSALFITFDRPVYIDSTAELQRLSVQWRFTRDRIERRADLNGSDNQSQQWVLLAQLSENSDFPVKVKEIGSMLSLTVTSDSISYRVILGHLS